MVWGKQRMIYQNLKMDQEEWDELLAEAREMGLIEDRQIGIGEET